MHACPGMPHATELCATSKKQGGAHKCCFVTGPLGIQKHTGQLPTTGVGATHWFCRTLLDAEEVTRDLREGDRCGLVELGLLDSHMAPLSCWLLDVKHDSMQADDDI